MRLLSIRCSNLLFLPCNRVYQDHTSKQKSCKQQLCKLVHALLLCQKSCRTASLLLELEALSEKQNCKCILVHTRKSHILCFGRLQQLQRLVRVKE